MWNRFLVSMLIGVAMLGVSCSDDATSPSAQPTTRQADLEAYFDQVAKAFNENFSIDRINAENLDFARLILDAVGDFGQIAAPPAAQEVHRKLVEAGLAYSSSFDAAATAFAAGEFSDDARTPPDWALEAFEEIESAQQEFDSVCVDLLALADANGIDQDPCDNSPRYYPSVDSCADTVSPHIVDSRGTYDEAVTQAIGQFGSWLPFPDEVPPEYSTVSSGIVSLGFAADRSPQPSPVAEGAGIELVPDLDELPSVSIFFAALPRCGPFNVVDSIAVQTEGRAILVPVVESSAQPSSSESSGTKLIQTEAFFMVGQRAATIQLRWYDRDAPGREEQAALVRTWIERVYAAECMAPGSSGRVCVYP